MAAGFCPKNKKISFCPKNNGFARVRGLQPPSPLAWLVRLWIRENKNNKKNTYNMMSRPTDMGLDPDPKNRKDQNIYNVISK